MSSLVALKPVITEAGMQAIFNATSDGVQAKITHVALGSAGYEIAVNASGHATATELSEEVDRFQIQDGGRVGPHQITVTTVADSDEDYWLREVGFFLEDGTLLALWSNAEKPLTYKSAQMPVILPFDVVLAALPAESVTVEVTGPPLELLMTAEIASLVASIANLQRLQIKQKAEIVSLKSLTRRIERLEQNQA